MEVIYLQSLEEDLQFKINDKLLAIDDICYGKIDRDDLGDDRYWQKINKYCHTFVLMNDNTPIGYADLIFLNKNGENTLINDSIHDGILTNLISLNDKKILYLISICILPIYRNHGYAKLLINTSFERLLKSKNTEKIYAITWSDDGYKLLNKYGAKTIKIDKYGHKTIIIDPKYI